MPRNLLLLAAALLALPLLTVSNLAAQPASPDRALSERSPQPGQPAPPAKQIPAEIELPKELTGGLERWLGPDGFSDTLKVAMTLTVVSLAPAILLMTTSFVRIMVVLSLLRQALGTQQLPPTQVITSLAMFMTLVIMTPVWKQTYEEAIVPYTQQQLDCQDAWRIGTRPVRRFMSLQIERTGNHDAVWLFLSYLPKGPTPETYDDVPLTALVPAFVLSELKTAFLIGFQIYLSFVIIDLVVSSITVSMGMMMLPPTMLSVPLKLLLFVLVDGWYLVVGMLLESFEPLT